MNKLDPRNYRNKLAGTTVKPKTGGNPLTQTSKAFSKHKAPLAVDTGRLGLVYRSMEDGKNLIEAIVSPKTREQGLKVLTDAIDRA